MPNPHNFDMSQVDLGSGADIDGFLSSNTNDGIYQTSPILQTVMPEKATKDNFQLNTIEAQGAPGIDALFASQPALVEPKRARKLVASIRDLKAFTRVSAESLIHKSEKDLWALKKEADGRMYIERLFDDNGEPLKG